MRFLDKFLDTWVKLFSSCKNPMGKLRILIADLFENKRTAAGSSRRAFASEVPFKLSDLSYSPRAIIVYYSRVFYASVLCERMSTQFWEEEKVWERHRTPAEQPWSKYIFCRKINLFSIYSWIVLFYSILYFI